MWLPLSSNNFATSWRPFRAAKCSAVHACCTSLNSALRIRKALDAAENRQRMRAHHLLRVHAGAVIQKQLHYLQATIVRSSVQ